MYTDNGLLWQEEEQGGGEKIREINEEWPKV